MVDRGGQLKALQRADGAGSHTVDASRRKAYTAASTRSNASAILEDIQKNPDAANLSMADGFLNFGRWDADGGAPGGQPDDQCAAAGINKINGRLK